MSSTSSDEEFESADEGDSTDVSEVAVVTEDKNPLDASRKLCEVETDVSTTVMSLTETSSEITESTVILEEVQDSIKLETHNVNSESRLETDLNERKNLKSNQDLEKELIEVSEEIQNSVVISEKEQEPVKNNVSEEIEHVDVTVPSDVAKKISTRSISSKTRQKSRPSLGAKKLGAVRISQTVQQSESATSNEVEDTPKHTPWQHSSSQLPQETGNDGWGSWFAPPKSLLSSVSSLTNQIMATVETGFNIPDPEELARLDAIEKTPLTTEDKVEDATEETAKKAVGFSQLIGGVSNITRFVESTSSKVLSTGLDTLELLGKKTINVLQQTDPGLKKTKAALVNPLQQSSQHPCLSQILKEAKELSEQQPVGEQHSAVQPTQKSSNLFEDHHGLVHLEALEMLSRQYENRVSPQIRRLTAQRRAVLEEIATLCTQMDENQDDTVDPDEFDIDMIEQSLASSLDKINLEVPYAKLVEAVRTGFEVSAECSVESPDLIASRALKCLAQVTSLAMELFHKAAELLLMAEKTANPLINGKLEADAFQSIAFLLGREILRLGGHLANQVIQSDFASKTNSHYATEIYYEASNYNSYIRNALKLMTPILQSRVV